MVPAPDRRSRADWPGFAASEITVLHVEDDPAFADLAVRFLEDDDGGPPLRVQTETDPEAAIERIDNVDCVVSDYDMPGLDGLDVLERVRERDADIPFVLFTGRGNEEIAARAISAGVTDYLRKGSGSDQFTVLANTVRNAASRRRARDVAERSRGRLRRVLDLLPQCVLVKNVDGRYLLVNEAGADHYDCRPEDLEGRFESEFVREELAERFRAEDRDVLESGEPMHIPEQRVVGPDGTERVEHVTKIPFDLPESEKPAVLVVAENVTEEVQRKRRLESVGDAVADAREAFADLDADGPAADRLAAALEDAAEAAADDADAGDSRED
ncbi:MAG: response regulator [Halobacterium sp.]